MPWEPDQRLQRYRASVIAVLWLLAYVGISRYGVYALPQSVARRTTLGEYLLLVQLLTAALGCILALALGEDAGSVRALLPILPSDTSRDEARRTRAAVHRVIIALLLGPLIYVAAHATGMFAAYDVLLKELAAQGARAVQEQTGQLGRAARADSLFIIVPFVVLVAPLGEELLFRGAVYGAVQGWFSPGGQRPLEPISESDPLRVLGLDKNRRASALGLSRTWARGGGVAWLSSSACFALMHADTPGGMGILRWVSALVLGLGCGWVRRRTGWLGACWALHASYNLVSLGTLRNWFVFSGWPTRYALPTILLVVAPALASFALVLAWTARKHAGGVPS